MIRQDGKKVGSLCFDLGRVALPLLSGLMAVVLALSPRAGVVARAAMGPPMGSEAAVDSLVQDWNSDGAIAFDRAALFARLSQAAYSAESDWRSAFEAQGFTTSGPIESGTMMAFVARRDDVAIVVFRGTDSDDKADWKVNFDVDRVKVEGGHIHHGFYAAYESLKEKIRGELGRQRPGHLWATGHSLGGALAIIAAHDLDADFKVHGVVTFGQPMVGQRDLARAWSPAFKGRYQRFVFESDLVCRLPPRGKHFGSLVWRKRKEIKRNDSRRLFKDREEEEEEIAPVTDEEFQAIQAAVDEMPKERRRRRRDEPPAGESPAQATRMHGTSDHAIKNYVDWLENAEPIQGGIVGEKGI